MKKTGVSRLVQVATFHPMYQFQGTEEDDITNFTNRSPYPMIHILRVSEVRDAIAQYEGNTEEIYTRNKDTMRRMTKEKITEAFKTFGVCRE